MILIFALVAALAQASFVTQSLEERLLSIEERIKKCEDFHGQSVPLGGCRQNAPYFAIPNQGHFYLAPETNYQTLENKNIRFTK